MLHILIAAGLLLGIVTGILGASGSELFLAIALASEPFGTAFMSAIRMVIIPLVMGSYSLVLRSSGIRGSLVGSVAVHYCSSGSQCYQRSLLAWA